MATLPGEKSTESTADAEIGLEVSPPPSVTDKEPKISVPPVPDLTKMPEHAVSGGEYPTTAKPPETPEARLDRLFLKRQKKTEAREKQEERLDRLYRKRQMQYFDDVQEGIRSVFLDIADIGPNVAIETMDLLIAEDRYQRGLFPADSPTFGVKRETLDPIKKMLKDPATRTAEWMGVLTKPEDRPPVFGLKPGQHPPESEQYRFGRWMGENAIVSILMPYLSKLPYPKGKIQPYATKRGFSLKEADLTKWEKIRRFFSGAGKVALEKPLQTAAIETGPVGIGGALGDMYARRHYPDSLAAQFALPVIGASTLSGLLYRSIWGGLTHLKDAGVNKYGSSGAIRKAQKRVQGAIADRKQALKNLNDLDQFIPEVMEKMTVAERSMDEGMIALQKAFIREAAEHLELEDNIRWKEIHDMLVEIAATPQSVENISYSKETINKALVALNTMMDVRISVAQTKLQKKLLEGGTKLSAQDANKIAKDLVLQERKIFDLTETQLWNALAMDTRFPTSPIHSGFETLLREIRPESGKGLLDLSEGKGGPKALYEFIGNLKSVTRKDVVTGKEITEKVFIPGKWGDEIDLRALQDIRQRVLLEKRKEQALPVPNLRKISMLVRLDEAFMHSLGGLQRTGLYGPLTKESAAYAKALYFSRQFKTKFGQKHIHQLLKTDRHGNVVPEELTLMKIFRGPEAETGATVVTEFEKALANIADPVTGETIAGTPKVVEELLGAMESLIKYRFYNYAVEGNVIKSAKAEKFMADNKQLFDKFPDLRKDFEKAVAENNTVLLREKRFNQAGKQIQDEKGSLATIYIHQSPKQAFDDLYTSETPRVLNKELNRLIRLAKKEPTGKARDGLDGAFLQWLMNKATHTRVASLKGEFISGMELKQIWESANVQSVAKKLLSKKKQAILEKVIRHFEALDLSRLTHAARGGVFDQMPDKFIESLGRIIFMRISPLPPTGASSIAQAQLVSTRAKELIRKHYRDPAIRYMTEAFLHNGGDMEKMMVLFADINDPTKIPYIMKQMNSFAVTSTYNLGEKALEEEEATMEQPQ